MCNSSQKSITDEQERKDTDINTSMIEKSEPIIDLH